MIFKAIPWWPGAYHVFYRDKRIGIVQYKVVRGTREYSIWRAYNHNFNSIAGEFNTRREAAEAICS